MKRTVWTFGLISGLISAVLMGLLVAGSYGEANFDGGEWKGYATMILALSMVFVGVRQYRDKVNGGSITFGRAFLVGLYIALIAATIYVIAWLIEYYLFFPNFMEKYAEYMQQKAVESGASQADISAQAAEMAPYMEMYKNPLFVILFTYMEIVPVGLIVSLITALILKRKPHNTGYTPA